VIGRRHAWQQKHSGCQTPPMQLKNLPWPISVLHPAQILKADLQKTIKSLFLIVKKDS